MKLRSCRRLDEIEAGVCAPARFHPKENCIFLALLRSYPFLLDTARDFLIDSMNSAKLDVRITIEGKDFAMIEDFVQTLVNLMIDAGTDETIKHLKDSCEKQQVEKKIIKYLNQQKKYNGLYSVAEEYDFAGICNYLKENSFQKVLDAISGTDSQRKAARSELYTGAYHAAHAETAQSKEKVRRLVSETVDILREIQHSKILLSDRVMQAEIVDDVNAHTDKAIEALAKKAQENNQSPFSPENVNKLGSNHEYEKLNTLSKQFQNQLGTQHPLYPYYQFTPSQEYAGNLVSSPLRDDARKKYPPRFVLNGIAKIGDDQISELSPEIIEYANRHQLLISLEIHSAIKYLGEEKDPMQIEAESLIGTTIIKKPREFPEPRPFSIRIDGDPIFDYIELGAIEILEDDSIVLTNEKQLSPLLKVRLVLNAKTNSASISMEVADQSSETHLRYVSLMKAVSEGKNISLYDLKNNTTFLSGVLKGCDYKSRFANIDDELDFLKRICEIEKYFSVKLKIPDSFTRNDYKLVFYLSDLIRGERVKRNIGTIECTAIVGDEIKKTVMERGRETEDLVHVGPSRVTIFDHAFDIQIVRELKNVRFMQIDKIKALLNILNNGDTFPLKLELVTKECYESLPSEGLLALLDKLNMN